MKSENYDYLFKIVLAGGQFSPYLDSGVGKTNLVSRFKGNPFVYDSKPTIGVQFESKTIQIQKKIVKCQIWDTAGQDRFKAIASVYYRGAVGALIVYDITRSDTFQNIDIWLKQVRENADPNLVVMLIGNKSDLQDKRVIKTQIAQQYAQQNGLLFMQTSAANLKNVNEAFEEIIRIIFGKIRVIQPISPPTTDPNITHPRIPSKERPKLVPQPLIRPQVKKKKNQCCK